MRAKGELSYTLITVTKIFLSFVVHEIGIELYQPAKKPTTTGNFVAVRAITKCFEKYPDNNCSVFFQLEKFRMFQ